MNRKLGDIQKRTFWCASGDCMEKWITGCKASLPVPGIKLVDHIYFAKQDWTFFVFVFYGDYNYDMMVYKRTGVMDEVRQGVNDEAKKFNSEPRPDYVGLGWFATPTHNLNQLEVERSAVRFFEKQGAWDPVLTRIVREKKGDG